MSAEACLAKFDINDQASCGDLSGSFANKEITEFGGQGISQPKNFRTSKRNFSQFPQTTCGGSPGGSGAISFTDSPKRIVVAAMRHATIPPATARTILATRVSCNARF